MANFPESGQIALFPPRIGGLQWLAASAYSGNQSSAHKPALNSIAGHCPLRVPDAREPGLCLAFGRSIKWLSIIIRASTIRMDSERKSDKNRRDVVWLGRWNRVLKIMVGLRGTAREQL